MIPNNAKSDIDCVKLGKNPTISRESAEIRKEVVLPIRSIEFLYKSWVYWNFRDSTGTYIA